MQRPTRRVALQVLVGMPAGVGACAGAAGRTKSDRPATKPAQDEAAGDGLPLLHRAAARADLATLRALLVEGADPNALEPVMGLSALHKAAYSGSAMSARLLLEHGAFVDLQAPSIGNTPLHDAISFRNGAPLDLIEALLGAGASLAIRNHPGMTPLELAERLGDEQVAARLRDEAGARMPSAFVKLMDAVKAEDTVTVQAELPAAKELVNHQDEQGFAPLSWASRTGQTEVVALLLAHGSDPNQLDRWMGAHAGHKAAFWGHAEALHLLIVAGLDIDAQGKYNGYTALHDAVSQRHHEVARVLVEAGARVDIVAHDGTTAVSIASALRDDLMQRLLDRK